MKFFSCLTSKSEDIEEQKMSPKSSTVRELESSKELESWRELESITVKDSENSENLLEPTMAAIKVYSPTVRSSTGSLVFAWSHDQSHDPHESHDQHESHDHKISGADSVDQPVPVGQKPKSVNSFQKTRMCGLNSLSALSLSFVLHFMSSIPTHLYYRVPSHSTISYTPFIRESN